MRCSGNGMSRRLQAAEPLWTAETCLRFSVRGLVPGVRVRRGRESAPSGNVSAASGVRPPASPRGDKSHPREKRRQVAAVQGACGAADGLIPFPYGSGCLRLPRVCTGPILNPERVASSGCSHRRRDEGTTLWFYRYSRHFTSYFAGRKRHRRPSRKQQG